MGICWAKHSSDGGEGGGEEWSERREERERVKQLTHSLHGVFPIVV